MPSPWEKRFEPKTARLVEPYSLPETISAPSSTGDVVPSYLAMALRGYIDALTSPCSPHPQSYMRRLRHALDCLDNAIWSFSTPLNSPIGVPIPPADPDPALVVVSDDGWSTKVSGGHVEPFE